MGCNSSKPAVEVTSPRSAAAPTNNKAKTKKSASFTAASTPVADVAIKGNDEVFNLLATARKRDALIDVWSEIKEIVDSDATAAAYRHPKTKRMPLHIACSMVDLDDGMTENFTDDNSIVESINALIRACPASVGDNRDSKGHIPLHYVLSPGIVNNDRPPRFQVRAQVVRALVAADKKGEVKKYLSKNDAVFQDDTGGVTPLYFVLQTLPNDFDADGPTVEYVAAIQEAYPSMVPTSNASDGDKPLALLYRRFTRQFDLSEKFFPGDNSRPEVVDHRRKYKMAAGNTWKIIEILLRPEGGSDHWRVVHRAIQVETPPDLLRYIIETNAQELTEADEYGNLPLHYAAKSLPHESSFPAFYTKYVVDELLYKFPEAAGIPDSDGQLPFSMAVQTGKQWIGGGVKSLYDANPNALGQVNLDAHASLKKALSFDEEKEVAAAADLDDGEEALASKGIVRDEHHDAVMLVQKKDIDLSEVVSAMWAHEEDAGVQMLACMAIARHVDATKSDIEVLRIALSTVAAVVNAMKAHPNEPIVQERACSALKRLARADGDREVSFVASGAIAAIIGAMQAHIGDANVQEETCAAIAEVVYKGGSDRATIVASVSGITALVNALAAHPDNEKVQIQGCRALKQLTDFPHANVPDLPTSQLEPLLEEAKKSFPSSCSESIDILLTRMS